MSILEHGPGGGNEFDRTGIVDGSPGPDKEERSEAFRRAVRNDEVARFTRRAKDLRNELAELTDLERDGLDRTFIRKRLAGKLARVEIHIFRLLQMPLFPNQEAKRGRRRKTARG